jgi:hypothetical protein
VLLYILVFQKWDEGKKKKKKNSFTNPLENYF